MSKLIINTWVGSLMFLLSFSVLQTYLDLQIFMFSSFFHHILKLLKSDCLVFPTLTNLVINTYYESTTGRLEVKKNGPCHGRLWLHPRSVCSYGGQDMHESIPSEDVRNMASNSACNICCAQESWWPSLIKCHNGPSVRMRSWWCSSVVRIKHPWGRDGAV
jgi:hypothetical protein